MSTLYKQFSTDKQFFIDSNKYFLFKLYSLIFINSTGLLNRGGRVRNRSKFCSNYFFLYNSVHFTNFSRKISKVRLFEFFKSKFSKKKEILCAYNSNRKVGFGKLTWYWVFKLMQNNRFLVNFKEYRDTVSLFKFNHYEIALKSYEKNYNNWLFFTNKLTEDINRMSLKKKARVLFNQYRAVKYNVNDFEFFKESSEEYWKRVRRMPFTFKYKMLKKNRNSKLKTSPYVRFFRKKTRSTLEFANIDKKKWNPFIAKKNIRILKKIKYWEGKFKRSLWSLRRSRNDYFSKASFSFTRLNLLISSLNGYTKISFFKNLKTVDNRNFLNFKYKFPLNSAEASLGYDYYTTFTPEDKVSKNTNNDLYATMESVDTLKSRNLVRDFSKGENFSTLKFFNKSNKTLKLKNTSKFKIENINLGVNNNNIEDSAKIRAKPFLNKQIVFKNFKIKSTFNNTSVTSLYLEKKNKIKTLKKKKYSNLNLRLRFFFYFKSKVLVSKHLYKVSNNFFNFRFLLNRLRLDQTISNIFMNNLLMKDALGLSVSVRRNRFSVAKTSLLFKLFRKISKMDSSNSSTVKPRSSLLRDFNKKKRSRFAQAKILFDKKQANLFDSEESILFENSLGGPAGLPKLLRMHKKKKNFFIDNNNNSFRRNNNFYGNGRFVDKSKVKVYSSFWEKQLRTNFRNFTYMPGLVRSRMVKNKWSAKKLFKKSNDLSLSAKLDLLPLPRRLTRDSMGEVVSKYNKKTVIFVARKKRKLYLAKYPYSGMSSFFFKLENSPNFSSMGRAFFNYQSNSAKAKRFTIKANTNISCSYRAMVSAGESGKPSVGLVTRKGTLFLRRKLFQKEALSTLFLKKRKFLYRFRPKFKKIYKLRYVSTRVNYFVNRRKGISVKFSEKFKKYLNLKRDLVIFKLRSNTAPVNNGAKLIDFKFIKTPNSLITGKKSRIFFKVQLLKFKKSKSRFKSRLYNKKTRSAVSSTATKTLYSVKSTETLKYFKKNKEFRYSRPFVNFGIDFKYLSGSNNYRNPKKLILKLKNKLPLQKNYFNFLVNNNNSIGDNYVFSKESYFEDLLPFDTNLIRNLNFLENATRFYSFPKNHQINMFKFQKIALFRKKKNKRLILKKKVIAATNFKFFKNTPLSFYLNSGAESSDNLDILNNLSKNITSTSDQSLPGISIFLKNIKVSNIGSKGVGISTKFLNTENSVNFVQLSKLNSLLVKKIKILESFNFLKFFKFADLVWKSKRLVKAEKLYTKKRRLNYRYFLFFYFLDDDSTLEYRNALASFKGQLRRFGRFSGNYFFKDLVMSGHDKWRTFYMSTNLKTYRKVNFKLKYNFTKHNYKFRTQFKRANIFTKSLRTSLKINLKLLVKKKLRNFRVFKRFFKNKFKWRWKKLYRKSKKSVFILKKKFWGGIKKNFFYKTMDKDTSFIGRRLIRRLRRRLFLRKKLFWTQKRFIFYDSRWKLFGFFWDKLSEGLKVMRTNFRKATYTIRWSRIQPKTYFKQSKHFLWKFKNPFYDRKYKQYAKRFYPKFWYKVHRRKFPLKRHRMDWSLKFGKMFAFFEHRPFGRVYTFYDSSSVYFRNLSISVKPKRHNHYHRYQSKFKMQYIDRDLEIFDFEKDPMFIRKAIKKPAITQKFWKHFQGFEPLHHNRYSQMSWVFSPSVVSGMMSKINTKKIDKSDDQLYKIYSKKQTNCAIKKLSGQAIFLDLLKKKLDKYFLSTEFGFVKKQTLETRTTLSNLDNNIAYLKNKNKYAVVVRNLVHTKAIRKATLAEAFAVETTTCYNRLAYKLAYLGTTARLWNRAVIRSRENNYKNLLYVNTSKYSHPIFEYSHKVRGTSNHLGVINLASSRNDYSKHYKLTTDDATVDFAKLDYLKSMGSAGYQFKNKMSQFYKKNMWVFNSFFIKGCHNHGLSFL